MRANTYISRISQSPLLARVVPFVLFVGLTSLQDFTGEAGRCWMYLAKTVLGGWLVWRLWPAVPEMRWQFSGAAVLVGVGVFILWIGLDSFLVWLGFAHSYPQLKFTGGAWHPEAVFGAGLAWFINGARLLGSSLVVPPIEEVFYRSFLYRYLQKNDFLSVPLGRWAWGPFLLTSLVFGLGHKEWLAGLLCGFAYQGLVCWKNRLGDALTAHTITNALLGVYVITRGAWQFW